MPLPLEIEDEEQLDALLTEPSVELIEFIRRVRSPLMILGAGGKMGPSLAVMAKRAAERAGHPLEVVAVSRFNNASAKQWLEARGVQTVSADLLEREAVEQLPSAENIIYLVGLKFGTAENPGATWASNTLPPAHVAARYAASRIVALSSGNVYPLSPVSSGGVTEDHPLTPLGEYGNAVVARERIFEYFSRKNRTPIALIRLFYAYELRYGVLVDLARKILAGEPIQLSTGSFNCIWQRDANDFILRSLGLTAFPPSRFNLCNPEIYPVREVAAELGGLLGVPPLFSEAETETALLGNPARLCALLGNPPTPLEETLKWVASWARRGGRNLGKPTHFEARDGVY